MTEEKELAKYTAKDGQELSITESAVRKYLVSGKSELITSQEIMYFLGVCKSRGLNPFKKDCYLIKYGNDPAAIITSIDYFRSRAKAQPDCRGWKKGIIVIDENGNIKDSLGLILEGETLIGGWFEAKPAGWDEVFRLEVNLKGYIKKTRDGKTTKFWQEDNQPTMIAKVAEGQGLRTLWPDEFQGMYEEAEIQETIIDIEPNDMSLTEAVDRFEAFRKERSQEPEDVKLLEDFVRQSAEALGITTAKLKAQAADDLDSFWMEFEKWRLRQSDPVATNWWDHDRHWRFLKSENFGKMVCLGLNLATDLSGKDYPGALNTLLSASDEIKDAIAVKYDRLFGIGAFEQLAEPKDEALELAQAQVLKDILKAISGYHSDIIAEAQQSIGAVGETPKDPDGAQELLDACKKIDFKAENGG